MRMRFPTNEPSVRQKMAKKIDMKLSEFNTVVGDATKNQSIGGHREIKIELIDVLPQIRTIFDDEEMQQLATSIDRTGVQQPIIVLAQGGRYRLIAGERRVRACKTLGLENIPAIIKTSLDEDAILEIQIDENIKASVHPYDIAMAVISHVSEKGIPATAAKWKVSVAWVSKRLAVKDFPDEIVQLLRHGHCSDMEILNSLAQLHAHDHKKFVQAYERIMGGENLTREDVRHLVKVAKPPKAKDKSQSLDDLLAAHRILEKSNFKHSQNIKASLQLANAQPDECKEIFKKVFFSNALPALAGIGDEYAADLVKELLTLINRSSAYDLWKENQTK